ncbi:MAG: hypothetical protein AMXMBFR33_49320 [Candidatus Xenobia bacterium]
MRRPDNLIYGLEDTPPLGPLALLGLQMALLLSILLIIVLLVTGAADLSFVERQNAVSLALIALAIGAGLQTWPRFGSGLLAPPLLAATYLGAALHAVKLGGMALFAGMTVFAGVCEVVLAGLLGPLRRLVPAYLCGLITVSVGFEVGLLGSSRCWASSLPRLLGPMLGLVLGSGLALGLGQVDPARLALLGQTPWVGLPHLPTFGYRFEASCVLPFLVASLACALKAVGVLVTAQKSNDADWRRPDARSLRRGVLADGTGCLVAGLLAAPGLSVSPSAVSISAATGATSRMIGLSAAGWLLLFALLPRLAGAILILPEPVLGGALVYTGSTLLISGLRLLTSAPLDARHTAVIGISIFVGLSHQVYRPYFNGSAGTVSPHHRLDAHPDDPLRAHAPPPIALWSAAHDPGEGPGPDPRGGLVARQRGGAPRGARDHDATGAHGRAGPSQPGEVKVQLAYDETSYSVELAYQGTPLVMSRSLASTDPDLQGLVDFLEGLQPDELHTSTKGKRCQVRVAFGL